MYMTITWHTKKDGHRICPICQELDNEPFIIPVGEGNFPDTLVHPAWGAVWDMSSGSAVHGMHGMKGDCKCTITHDLTPTLQEILMMITEVADRLEQVYGQGGGEMTAWEYVAKVEAEP